MIASSPTASQETPRTGAIAWEPPVFDTREFFPKRTRYCFCLTVLNEGDRLRGQLARMQPRADLADIIIADGRTTDGSTDPDYLKSMGIRTLLDTSERGLCTATRMAVAYALEQGYEGVVTCDGNGKDGVEALPEFLRLLDDGYDMVQGSRFARGGVHTHTPLERQIAIRLIQAPLIALAGGFHYSDPTNAFRAMSRRFLTDERVQPIRRIFVRFNLQIYFIYRAAQLGFRVTEIPVVRVYPADGTVPTKIVRWQTKVRVFRELLQVVFGRCNP
jgi:dolichol-phosphate mannosyltransferase